jgi:hypothetical protein
LTTRGCSTFPACTLSADERDGTADSELAFDLAAISDERFQKKDMPRLLAALGVPDIITLSNGQRLPEMEALCISCCEDLSKPPR